MRNQIYHHQKGANLGDIKQKLPKRPFTCEMCKAYITGKPVYIYRPWAYQENLKDLEICPKCAKREHGAKNKKPLPE